MVSLAQNAILEVGPTNKEVLIVFRGGYIFGTEKTDELFVQRTLHKV